MWTKARVGKWLLYSCPVAFVIVIITFIIDEYLVGIHQAISALIVIFTVPLIVFGLPTGIILTIWTSIATKRQFKEAQAYGELNGWLPISRTQWRARKRDATSLIVTKSVVSTNYILTLEHDGEVVTIDQFETLLWGMQFGDWLWNELRDVGAITTDEVLDTAARGSQSLVILDRQLRNQ